MTWTHPIEDDVDEPQPWHCCDGDPSVGHRQGCVEVDWCPTCGRAVEDCECSAAAFDEDDIEWSPFDPEPAAYRDAIDAARRDAR